VKRTGIVLLAGIMAFVGLVSVFAGVGGQIGRISPVAPQQPGLDPYEGFQTETPPATRGRITGPNEPPMIVGDANEIRARMKKYEGLEMSLMQVEVMGRNEEREWTQMEIENRLELARAVKAQMKEELMLLRKLALEEKAEKTATAIDGLLLSRQDRFSQVIQRIQTEEAKITAREEQQRGNTRTGRTVGGRGAVQGPYDQTMQGGAGANQPQRGTTRRRR